MMSAPDQRKQDARRETEEMQLGWRMAGLAFTMSSEAAAGAIIGWLIDYFAGTGSRWLLIGAIVGIAVGMLGFIRGAIAMNRLLSAQERDRAARGIPPPAPLKDEQADQDSWDKDWPKEIDGPDLDLDIDEDADSR